MTFTNQSVVAIVTILIGVIGCGSEILRGLPVNRQEWGEVVLVAHRRQAGEHVFHVSVRVFAVALAGDDDRVDDGRALASVGVADKQPILFPNG